MWILKRLLLFISAYFCGIPVFCDPNEMVLYGKIK